MPVTSIFSFSHYVFLSPQNIFQFFTHIYVVVCIRLLFWTCLDFWWVVEFNITCSSCKAIGSHKSDGFTSVSGTTLVTDAIDGSQHLVFVVELIHVEFWFYRGLEGVHTNLHSIWPNFEAVCHILDEIFGFLEITGSNRARGIQQENNISLYITLGLGCGSCRWDSWYFNCEQ